MNIKGNFKFKDYFKLIKQCVHSGLTDERLFQIIFDEDNYDLANVNRYIHGKDKIPKVLVKKIMFEGVLGVEKRLLRHFPSTYLDFWGTISNEMNELPGSVSKCFDKCKENRTSEKLAILLIEALINTSCSWSKDKDAENDDYEIPVKKDTNQSCTDIFQFLKNENLDNIKSISIMFHAGGDWHSDHSLNGRGALLKRMSEKVDIRILINHSPNVQKLFDTGYLKSEFGSYDKINETVQKWKNMAEIYRFSLKSFPYIFFHSLCILEYKDSRKKMYVSNYIYKEGIAVEQHPKSILTDTDSNFNTYYAEYDFIWNNSKRIYEPDNKVGSLSRDA